MSVISHGKLSMNCNYSLNMVIHLNAIVTFFLNIQLSHIR